MLKSGEEVGEGRGVRYLSATPSYSNEIHVLWQMGQIPFSVFKSMHRSCASYPQKPEGGGPRLNNFGFYLDFEVQSFSSEVDPFKPTVSFGGLL